MINSKLSKLFIKLEKNKKRKGEIILSENHIGWKGFHPELIPNTTDAANKNLITIAIKTKNGKFTEGFIKPNISDDFLITVRRTGNDYEINISGNLKNDYSYDAVAFLQRGGHGIKQGEAFDIITNHGYKGVIFSPQLDNFSTKADKFPGKYLDEVGYTTHLRKNKKGAIQANLPTDPSDERFLLSLLAMISANWIFFLSALRAKLAVIDSKAEAGALVSAIQRNANPKLRIALVAYTLYDNLSRVPKEMVLTLKEYKKRLGIAGMKNYGVPDGLTFMKEKVDSVKNNKNATILYMSFQNSNEITKRAKKDGVNNILVIPQMSPKIIFSGQNGVGKKNGIKTHVMRLNSSTYLQVREILDVFFEVAKAYPRDKFFLMAKEEQYPDILPSQPPPNFKYLGWIETDRGLAKYILNADTLWIHGGNRPSVIESIHASKFGVLPIFFTQDQLTMNSVKFWSKRKLNLIKLLGLMMAVEPNVERWEMLTTIVAEDKILEKLLVNPLKPDIKSLIETIKSAKDIQPDVQKVLSRLKVATTDLFAAIYEKLLEGKNLTEIKRECSL